MRKTWKVIKWILVIFFVLLIGLVVVVQTSYFKAFVTKKASSYLKGKIKTEFRIGKIDYQIPNWVEINDLYAEDESGKLLLKGKKIKVNINMLGLLSGRYEINKVLLDEVQLNINRKAYDSSFNFQYIIDAFVKKDSTIKNDTSTSKPLVLKLEQVELRKVIASIDDKYSGMQLNANIASFTGQVDKLDLEKLAFVVNEIKLDHSTIKVRMLTKTAPPDTSKSNSSNPSFILKSGLITKSSVSFQDSALQLLSDNIIDSLSLTSINYATDKISADAIRLQNSKIQFANNSSLSKTTATVDSITQKAEVNKLVVLVKSIQLSGNNIDFKDAGKPITAKGFDPANIHLSNLSASLTDLQYSNKGILANVENIALQEAKGFQLDSLSAIVSVTDEEYKLDNMLVKTPNSYMRGNALIMPAAFTTNPTLNNEINLINTSISLKDIALINPAIIEKYEQQLGKNEILFISLAAKGNAKQFVIQALSAHTNTNDIKLSATGTLGNLNEPKNLLYDIALQDLIATKAFLQPFINKQSNQINLPPSIRLKGKITGSTTAANPDLIISSDYGIALVKGSVSGFNNQQNLAYNLRIAAQQLETGRWINKDSLLGKLTGYVTLKGKGIDYKKVSASSTINFSSFVVKQHEYNNIFLVANASNGLYHLNGDINDDALLMNLNTDIAFQKKYPSAKGFINIGNADFSAMGLSPDTLSFKSLVNFDIADLNPSTLKALIRLDSSTIVKGNQTFALDSMVANGIRTNDTTVFTIVSPVIDANLAGDFLYTHLPALANFYQEKYFGNNRKTNIDSISKTSFDMAVTVKPNPMLLMLIPGLFFDKNIMITAKADNANDSSILLNAVAPLLVYNTNRIAGFTAQVTGISDSIKYRVMVDSASTGSVQLFATNLDGGYSNNTLSAALITKNEAGKDQYALGVTGTKNNDTYQISLSDKLLLNYNSWQVSKNNLVTLSKKGFNVQAMEISKQQEKIAVASTSPEINAPVKIDIHQFALANITGILNQDSMMVDGNLNAAITLADFDKKIPTADGTLGVDSLQFQKTPVGNIFLNAKTIDNSGVAVDGTLTGNDNKVSLTATYNQQKINGTIDLEPINLVTVQAFSKGYLTGSKGNITGKIDISGAVTDPVWNGNLQFNDAVTTVASYGTQLKIDKQQINFTYPEIRLKQFTIKDSLNQPIVIDGTITQSKEEGFVTDLTVNTTNFTALDNTAAMNNNIYGKAVVDVDVQITGPATAPDISGNIALKDKSSITVVRQQSVPGENDRKGVVRFVDMDTISNKLVIPSVSANIKKRKKRDQLKYNLNIEISKDAKLSVIVDPLTRDELQVQGTAQLNAGVQPNGDIALTGAYNLSGGSYQLNYQFIKRKFELQDGSTILLSGDPANAEADITAVYEVNAVPYDLLGNELGGVAESESRLYKQKIPFQVVLKIKGSVLEPQLSFNIKLKEKVAGVNADLTNTINNKLLQIQSDASQMNKEVFALLIMGRFIGEQSKDFFASSGSGGGLQADQVVKESVSRFLSEAVNQLAADLIKGVDIDVNLKTVDDYSTATQRTDLSLGLSKRLLDDRLTISVGKNFTVDGDDPLARGQNNNNLKFLPDVSTNYKLSKDGKYAIRIYRRNQYEAILDGYFVETGIAFTFSVNYDKFKELFNKRPKNETKGK